MLRFQVSNEKLEDLAISGPYLFPHGNNWLPPLDGQVIFRLLWSYHSPLILAEVGTSCLLCCFLNP